MAKDTLYTTIVEQDDALSFDDENESIEEYKNRVATYFDAIEDEDEFDALPKPIIDWMSEAVDVIKANTTARKKKALPDIEGLEVTDEDESDDDDEEETVADEDAESGDEDVGEGEEEEEVKAKPKVKAAKTAAKEKPAKAAKPKAEKVKKEKVKKEKVKKEPQGRDPTANRYYRAAVLLMANPKISTPAAMQAAAKKKGWEYSEITAERMLECGAAFALAIKALNPKAYQLCFDGDDDC